MNDQGSDAAGGASASGDGVRSRRRGHPVGEMLYGLKEARILADLSGKELAEMAGLHEQTVRKIENLHGGADPRTTVRLAKALGVERRVLYEDPDL